MIVNTLLTKVFGTSHDREIKKILPQIQVVNNRGKELESLHDSELSALSRTLKEKIENKLKADIQQDSEKENERVNNILDDNIVEALAIVREAADRRLGILNILKEEVEFDAGRLSESCRGEIEKARQIFEEESSMKSIMLSGKFYQEYRQLYPESKWPYRMRCFDVQIIGGIILHRGQIAEMKTGEGKTLVATLAVYLNGLTGRGVHVITTNDYLAKVGVKDNLPLYEFLGLTVGVILSGLDEGQRRASYSADVTYGTNNEFGFDYLRDNMARNIKDCVQRELNYAIVDEVDSILIDEARTPLIISGPAEATTDKYVKCDKVIKTLHKDIHYTVDEKSRHVGLTEKGVTSCEQQLGIQNLYGDVNTEWVHHVTQALKANVFFKKDVDYILKNREVIIVDEFTGRLMEGRRFSDGLHQAIEAKEKVPIARENQTLATITFQNYFRMYNKLSGMTGTAETESTEFNQIYSLSVVAIPTNKPMVRDDNNDLIYRSNREKLAAIAEDIKERNETGQPVLVGTVSIEKSEEVSTALRKAGIKHEVLNAKQHEKEALIIEQAGQKGKITIATNMAGRGVDIKLGPGVIEVGGLYVLGTERHESRRIDNQLRGRSGRQGDPGESQFYLCLEDDLMRIFGSERIGSIMDKLGAEEGEVITHPLVNRAIANAQKRVEGQNFEIRKHLLEYDDVMNRQRTVIYKVRRKILKGEEIKSEIEGRLEDAVDILVSNYAEESAYPESWNLDGFYAEVKKSFGIEYSIPENDLSITSAEKIVEILTEQVLKNYQDIETAVGSEDLREIERQLLLMVIDHYWKEHLYSMDHLKEAIRFRGYAQKDPLQEYKREGLKMFESTLDRIAMATSERFLHIDTDFIVKQKEALAQRAAEYEQAKKDQVHSGAEASGSFTRPPPVPGASPQGPGPARQKATNSPVQVAEKVGRNEPCPCGSGKKYKKCHGAGG